MKKFIVSLALTALIISALSFLIQPKKAGNDNARQVKEYYHSAHKAFITESKSLKDAIHAGNEKKIQQAFIRTRLAYKKTEVFTEYFYAFYASRFNGPPIIFFEDKEADIGEQQPHGMQLMESFIFPKLDKSMDSLLQFEAAELVRYADESITVTESEAFDNNNIIDAVMEALYRITAMTITGFDSAVLLNSLNEAEASLQSLAEIMNFYNKEIEATLSKEKAASLQQLFTNAVAYLNKQNSFNGFDRMEFTRTYLNPIAILIGEYKKAAGFYDNRSLRFNAMISKNNSLFAEDIFDPKKFLDDYTISPEKIQLGKALFFDKRLSSTNDRSCATCHQPDKSFTDGLKTSLALDGHSSLPRNAPTLWNVAFQRKLFLDSRSNTLEEQVMAVLNNAKEMSGSADEMAKKIITSKDYTYLYKNAFPDAPAQKAAENICNAIASYERTLIALNSKFDRHMRGENLLNKREINGYNLFMGKAKCGTCHFTPLFSGAKPPRYYDIESEVLGVPAVNTKKNAKLDGDSGRYLHTGLPMHLFAFKTATLRNIELTAPYMHNGVFKTLEEVVDFYNNGGGQGLKIAPENQTLPFEKLNLTKKEQQDIVLFMKTLTDTTTVE